MKHRKQHSATMRAIAAVVVCLFTANTFAWAYPPSYTPPEKSTLAPQSILQPMLDVVGTQYATRLQFEMAAIVSMALEGLKGDKADYRSRLNMNAALDKQCASREHGFDRRYRKLLEVVANPELRDDGAVAIHLRTTRPARDMREFFITFRGDTVADVLGSSETEILAVSPSARFTKEDRRHMSEIVAAALQKAQEQESDRMPIIARVVDGQGKVWATESKHYEPGACKHELPGDGIHAEVCAVRKAEENGFTDWGNATVYTNLEPCYYCARMLTDFYGVKRVVFGAHDALDDTGRYLSGYQNNNVARIACTDNEINRTLSEHFKIGDTVPQRPVIEAFRATERDLAPRFREMHRAKMGKDVQVIVVNADIWMESGAAPWDTETSFGRSTMEHFMLRTLEMLEQRLNPVKGHILLFTGEEQNRKEVGKRIAAEGIFKAKPPRALAEKTKKVKQTFGENAIKDELDLNRDFHAFVEQRRRQRFLEGNEGGNKGVLEWLPLRVILLPLFRCAARCIHCYLGDSKHIKDQMSLEEMARIFDTTEFHIENPFTHVSGGEVLLRKDFIEMVERYPIASLATNASTMTSLEKAEEFVKALKNAYEKRNASPGQMKITEPALPERSASDRYEKSWRSYVEKRRKIIEVTHDKAFCISISLDDIHLAQPAISVEKIANLIAASVRYYPALNLKFISVEGRWKENAYPALQEELKEHKLTLELNEAGNGFTLTGEGGFEKGIDLQENTIERIGDAFNNLSDEYFNEAAIPEGKWSLSHACGWAVLDYRGNMSISDAFLAEHSPLVFGNVLERGWGSALKELDKDPLFRALVTSTWKILAIAEEYDPHIVDDIQDGKPGDVLTLLYWLLSSPERKLYVTYRLLQEYYEDGTLKGKDPFKGMSPDEIRNLVDREVADLRDAFRGKKSEAGIPVIRDEHIRLLRAGDEILNSDIPQEREHHEVTKEDTTWSYYVMGKNRTSMPMSRDGLDFEKEVSAAELQGGYGLKRFAGEGMLEIIETDQEYRIYTSRLANCIGVALRGKKDGKNVLIMAHILPRHSLMLHGIIRLLQGPEYCITDIQGILFTRDDTELSEGFRATVSDVNREFGLDLKVRLARTGNDVTDLVMTQDGIVSATYESCRIARRGFHRRMKWAHRPKSLEMYLWSDLTSEFDPDAYPVNYLDILKEERALLQYETAKEKSIPVGAVLERLLPPDGSKRKTEISPETVGFLNKFLHVYNIEHESLTHLRHEEADTEISNVAKEAIVSSELAKEFSRNTKKPVLAVGLAEVGTPYTWAMEDPLDQLSDRERSTFLAEVEEEKKRLGEVSQRDEVALFTVAGRWMQRGAGPRLTWFTHCINYAISSVSEGGEPQAKAFLRAYEHLFKAVHPGLLFLDAGYRTNMPHSFENIHWAIARGETSCTFMERRICHPELEPRMYGVVPADAYKIPFLVAPDFFTDLAGEALTSGEDVICLFINPTRTYWDGERRPFDTRAWHDNETRYGSALRDTLLALKDQGIFERAIRERVQILRESGWNPQIYNPEEKLLTDFDRYLKDNDLSQYTHLRQCFTPEVIEALLEDPAMRPVFLEVLPDEHLGPLEIVDENALRNIGGAELLLSHSAFSVGNAEVADRLIQEGRKIIIGVTDRWSEDAFEFKVANGRQCYFPLPNGMWLGVKGVGQFIYESRPPCYVIPNPIRSSYQGLTSEKDAEVAREAMQKLKKYGGSFVQFLGYRRLYGWHDGKGNLLTDRLHELLLTGGSTFRMTGTKDVEAISGVFNPVLSFSIVLNPHRLDKFPQMLKTDPGLKGLATRVSRVLTARGVIPAGVVLSPRDMLLRVMRELGRTEAIKQRCRLHKVTIHTQDFTFAGEESDIEEFLSYDEGSCIGEEAGKIFDTYDLRIEDLHSKVSALEKMVKAAREGKQADLLFPSAIDNLKALFRGYYGDLDDDRLRLWATHDECRSFIKKSLSIIALEWLHPDFAYRASPDGAAVTDMPLRERTIEMIFSWAGEELDRREAAREQLNGLVRQSKTVWPDMLTLPRLPEERQVPSHIMQAYGERYDVYNIAMRGDEDHDQARVQLGEKDGNLYLAVGTDLLLITDDLKGDVLYANKCKRCTGGAFRGQRSDGSYVYGVFHYLPVGRESRMKFIAKTIKGYGIDRIECAVTAVQEADIKDMGSVFEEEGIEILLKDPKYAKDLSGAFLSRGGTILGITSYFDSKGVRETQISPWTPVETAPVSAWNAEERPALEPHQVDVTEKVMTMLRTRLGDSPVAEKIFKHIETCNVTFIRGKPTTLPDGVPKSMLTRPAFMLDGYETHREGSRDIIERVAWANVYLESEGSKDSYWHVIHELTEHMVCVELIERGFTDADLLQELSDRFYTDAMTYLLMRYYVDLFRFNAYESSIMPALFIAGLSSLMSIEKDRSRVTEILKETPFGGELDRYFTVIADFVGAALRIYNVSAEGWKNTVQTPHGEVSISAEIADIIRNYDAADVITKVDIDKERTGLNDEELLMASWIADRFIETIEGLSQRQASTCPILAVLKPHYDATAPEDVRIPEMRNFLNRARRYLNDHPVDMVIDLSLIPEADMDANMRTWAYLVLIHNSYGLDVNYVFESKEKGLQGENAEQMLMQHIQNLASQYHLDISDIGKRINRRHDAPGTLEVRIMKLDDLKDMKALPDNVLPVAMSEGDTQYGVPVRDFVSATNIGLAQAACRKLKLEDNPDLAEIIEREILPRMQKIYARLFPDEDVREIVTKETVLNMIDGNPVVRRNLAIALALPPIVRVAIDELQKYHERIQDLLRAA